MKIKKPPMRKCVVTKERFEKRDLMRVVRTPEGEVIYDKTGRANGRGAYLSKSKAVIEKAKKTNILSRHLDIEIPDSLYQVLLEAVLDD